MPHSVVMCALVRRLLAAMLCAAATLATSAAERVPSASELMDWAEQHHAALFPSKQDDRLLPPYLYRHYPETGNYLGVTGDVWLLGPAAGGPESLLKVGQLRDFAAWSFLPSARRRPIRPSGSTSSCPPRRARRPT